MSRIPMKVLVLQYIYNRSDVIEQEYQTRAYYNRYHRVDDYDLLDQIIAKARLDLIQEISKDLVNILEIHDKR